uniref:Uncharacterized protein n=1 Tax=Arundo donax TaxID=35708 RepID=A0A0A9GYA4_ARUDO
MLGIIRMGRTVDRTAVDCMRERAGFLGREVQKEKAGSREGIEELVEQTAVWLRLPLPCSSSSSSLL